ncbi:BTAD domain-containing putative transcriptional regulator [Amycolatopsis oliviviridis]|uniref:SARP family transcriptional regulator n=1 Tax=Amycolatopsis oliviviridis TaxID=1471590 RepID=A0ABQ3L669_9PSEU|nr:BTAD domain-containing putative transcriptional regulator [Amycolatopsis oliviviridis]GHH05232.1 SARP family transcriptional regulator [Amycolatopsis oliviviridis]
MRFAVLGAIEAYVDERPVDLGHAVQQGVLAALLVDAGRVVPADQILDRVWNDRLPHRAVDNLYTYISRLRRIEGVDIVRRQGGYVLDVDPDDVDLHRFRALVEEAYGLADAEAVVPLDEALALWRGEPFGSLGTPWFAALRGRLVKERFAAWLHRNDIVLRLGGHAELIPGLLAATAEHPRDERLAGQLMLALYRDGRQAESLSLYDRLRRRLAEEQGVDPSPPLRRLHLQVVSADAAIAAPVEPAAPCQLPARPPVFVGRAGELEALDGRSSGVVVIGGPGGVGKTSFVLRWAHDRLDRFPDGQLYVNLRGFDPTAAPLEPGVVLRGFLDALQVSPERIPDDADGRGALFRGLVARRRLLVVLDNARDESQVRPLLPGGSECLVVVTSRSRLTGLVAAEQAHPLRMPMLDVSEAAALLTHRIDRRELADEADVEELVRFTGGLPLALAVVAARAIAHPGFPLRALVAELRDEQGRLDALDAGDPASSVRAVTSWSYHGLSVEAARLFRLLGVHSGPDIGLAAASALAGVTTVRVRPLLAELNRTHMVDEHSPGRFRSHDLLRAFAREQASEDETREALGRVLDHYLHTGFAAERRLSPHWPPITLTEPRDGAAPGVIATYDEAIGWFSAEHASILAAIELTVASGDFDTHAWQLPWTISTFLTRSGRWDQRAATQRIALDAAKRLGDRAAQAAALHLLGRVHSMAGDHAQALADLTGALTLYQEIGDLTGEATTHFSLGLAGGGREDHETALNHAYRALELFRARENRPWEAFSVSALGWYSARLGQDEPAIAYSSEALQLLRDVGDRDCEAHVLRTLGYVHHRRGEYLLAADYHALAGDLFHDLGDTYSEAATADQLGDARHHAGDVDAARQAWQRAEALLSSVGHPDAVAVRAKLTPGN